MTIREHAKSYGHEIVGKLIRHPEFEHDGDKFYLDEAGNEYSISRKGCCIVTVDGAVM